MRISLKVTRIGDGLGVVLSKEAVSALKIAEGDLLILSKRAKGFDLATSYDDEVARQIEVGRAFMKDYRETFAGLRNE